MRVHSFLTIRQLGLISLLLTGIIMPAPAQVIQAWVDRYNGPAHENDAATAMVLDAAGNIYVTGYSFGIGTGQDYTVIKYNSAGSRIWVARYNGPANGDDFAQAIAVDSNYNVFVTGQSMGIGTDYDYATIKYDPNGVELWVARYNGPVDSSDEAWAIAVDAAGNVRVTGGSRGSGSYYDYATVGYDINGNEQWVMRYNGSGNWVDRALAIATDPWGNVIVTGQSWGNSVILSDWATIKYNSSGVMQWIERYNNTYCYQGYSNDIARDLVVDNSGNIFVTGTIFSYSFEDFFTIKYSSTGSIQWTAWWDGWNGQNDNAYAIALDHAGNVIVAGSGQVADGIYTTIKYNSSGSESWEETYGETNDRILDVTTDPGDYIYVTGLSPCAPPAAGDIATIRYNPDGVQQWVKRYNGSGDNADTGKVVCVDASGNVYVTGSSVGNGTGSDFVTIKYVSTPTISLTPRNPPVIIPAIGGSFEFEVNVTNNTITAQTFDAWIMVRLPNQSWYGPVLGPLSVTLSGNSSITRLRSQNAPASAPAGEYWYEARVGDYPATVWDTSGFVFTKLGARGWGLGVGEEWLCTGEPFPGEEAVSPQPSAFSLCSISPNPFNPTTTISFELRAASCVKLSVYDTSGRLVLILADSWREGGAHEVTFDGSKLAAGIYLAKMEATSGSGATPITESFTTAQKLVLLK